MPTEGMWFDADAGTPSYTARELRGLSSALVTNYSTTDATGARAGKFPGGGVCTITGPTATQPVVNVPAGAGVVWPNYNAGDGAYIVTWDAIMFTLTRDASLTRTDRIVVYVEDDPIDGSGFRRVRVAVLAGTPGGGAPVTPQNGMSLATVEVPTGAGAATITQGALTVAAGGVIPVPTASFPAGAVEGTYLDVASTDTLYRSNGSTFEKLSRPLTTLTGTPTPSGWTVTATAYQYGPIISGRLDVTRTGANIAFDAVGNTGDTDICTLPADWRPATPFYGTMGNGTQGPYEISISASTGLVNVRSGIPNTTITSSGTYRINFTYIAASW